MKTILFSILLLCFSLESNAMNLNLKSEAFSQNGLIPSQYTCEGKSDLISPPLSWQDDSKATKSYVIIVDDPDAPAGTWDHWVLFNIDPSVKSLAEGASAKGATMGSNSWGQIGYKGPCPPSGSHRYFFKLYALDTVLGLKQGASKTDVLTAMKGHVIGTGELMGHYQKKH
jgi:Raf kinase inhibitor-like YbhB/YbcL family protein